MIVHLKEYIANVLGCNEEHIVGIQDYNDYVDVDYFEKDQKMYTRNVSAIELLEAIATKINSMETV